MKHFYLGALLLPLLAGLALADPAPVTVKEEPVVLPTYQIGPADLNPIYFTGRVYQGAQGHTYPYAMLDRLTDDKKDVTYKGLFLENEFVKICVMPEPDPEILRHFPVDEIWGVGRRVAKKLYGAGIFNAQAMAEASDIWLRKELTVTGWNTAMELRGIQCVSTDTTPVPRKSLLHSRSFGEKITDQETLGRVVATFTARAAERLRAEHLATRGITLRIASSPFVSGPQHDATAQILYPTGITDTRILQASAAQILVNLYVDGPAYCRAGVMFFDLVSADRQQASLQPGPEDTRKSRVLMQALDAINAKHGKRSLLFGREGLDPSAWAMRQENRSPRYTSNWEELPVATCR